MRDLVRPLFSALVEAQANRLRDLGCRLLQRFLFTRPMDGRATRRWLDATFGPPRPRVLTA